MSVGDGGFVFMWECGYLSVCVCVEDVSLCGVRIFVCDMSACPCFRVWYVYF